MATLTDKRREEAEARHRQRLVENWIREPREQWARLAREEQERYRRELEGAG